MTSTSWTLLKAFVEIMLAHVLPGQFEEVQFSTLFAMLPEKVPGKGSL